MAVVVAPEKGLTITQWPTAFPKSFGCFSGSNSFPVRVLLEAPLFFDFFLFFFDFTMKPCSLLAQGVDSSVL